VGYFQDSQDAFRPEIVEGQHSAKTIRKCSEAAPLKIAKESGKNIGANYISF
jgi:hypothetical protein